MKFLDVKSLTLFPVPEPPPVRRTHFNLQVWEPRVSDLFVVTFPERFNIPEFAVRSVTRPSARMDALGRINWEPINIVLSDLIEPSTSRAVMDFVAYFEEHPMETITVIIEMINRQGIVTEKWSIETRGFLNVAWSDLSYGNPDTADIMIELQPDYCILMQ
jgi:hypothetical protein